MARVTSHISAESCHVQHFIYRLCACQSIDSVWHVAATFRQVVVTQVEVAHPQHSDKLWLHKLWLHTFSRHATACMEIAQGRLRLLPRVITITAFLKLAGQMELQIFRLFALQKSLSPAYPPQLLLTHCLLSLPHTVLIPQGHRPPAYLKPKFVWSTLKMGLCISVLIKPMCHIAKPSVPGKL